jgi:hypothetical protein
MRRGFALIWLAATAVVSTIVGFISYQAGWAAGLATKVPEGAVGPYPYPYYYQPHFFGFGFFGLLPLLLVLLVLFAVFRGGRRWGRGGWGPRGYDRPEGPPSEQAAPGTKQV